MIKKKCLQYVSIVTLLLVGCQNEPYEGDIIIEDNSCSEDEEEHHMNLAHPQNRNCLVNLLFLFRQKKYGFGCTF